MTGGWMVSASGRRIFLLEPDPEQILLDDIAHALSMICRFGGHVREFYSVAQHSMLVSTIVGEGRPCSDLWLRTALMHDAAEAYLGDVVRPLKKALGPAYGDIEERWERAICGRFALPYDVMRGVTIKAADRVALVTERRHLVAQHSWPWVEDEAKVQPRGGTLEPLGPGAAKVAFLDRWVQLGGTVDENNPGIIRPLNGDKPAPVGGGR